MSVDTAAVHLFVDRVLFPSADFVAAFSALKLMMRHSILMNMETLSLFMGICELSNNPDLMHDVYCKLQSTLNAKICQNDEIIKCILMLFLKHKQWHWIDSVVQNVVDQHDGNEGIVVLEKCVLEMIEILVVLTKSDERREVHSQRSQEEVGSDGQSEISKRGKTPRITVNKQFVTDLVVSVLDGKKQDEAIHKMLTEMFAEYTRYLAANKEHIEMTKNRSRSRGRVTSKTQEPYIMLKMNERFLNSGAHLSRIH